MRAGNANHRNRRKQEFNVRIPYYYRPWACQKRANTCLWAQCRRGLGQEPPEPLPSRGLPVASNAANASGGTGRLK